MAENETRTATLGVKVSPGLKKRVEALAKKERRTVSALICMLLEREVEARSEPPPRKR